MTCAYSVSRSVNEVDGEGRAALNRLHGKLYDDTTRTDSLRMSGSAAKEQSEGGWYRFSNGLVQPSDRRGVQRV